MTDDLDIDDRDRVLDLLCSPISYSLQALVLLGVADHLGSEPTPIDEVARECQVDSSMLHRLLRVLAATGLMTVTDGRVALTARGQYLRTDHPATVARADFVRAWRNLDDGLRTGTTPYELANGTGVFQAQQADKEKAARFDTVMRERSRAVADVVAPLVELPAGCHVADIGGGMGTLLTSVLDRTPEATGTLFELPDVAARAAVEVDDRIRVHPGDFFEPVDLPADAYLLSWVLHDWDDDPATTILRHVRATAPDHARLLVAEIVMDGTPESFELDVEMLVLTGGRERTEREYRDLLAAGGWQLGRSRRSDSGFWVLEATAI